MDGAAPMKKYFEDILSGLRLEKENRNLSTEISEFRVRCICHMVNNVAEVGLTDDTRIVDRVRKLVTALRRTKAKTLLKSITKVKHVKLPLDVSTRRNSTLYMLKGAYKARHDLKKYVNLYASDQKNLLADNEWEDVKQMAEFREPMDKITTECSGSKEPTFHLEKPSLRQLQKHFEGKQS
ncbi:hypothetical protein RvY_03611 [Ramazzottius varieornatus]|uniref:HAT C-terminal dimerisation domain-containing protein n=1 Tax=Ramazzottius varieornatus TaxID=947166 RepID=A0A1D1UNN9_RAMVA|nr:hypothetical protein RvY_03611 [Ramazzottius varieornatus]